MGNPYIYNFYERTPCAVGEQSLVEYGLLIWVLVLMKDEFRFGMNTGFYKIK